jgi:hypothetical protein
VGNLSFAVAKHRIYSPFILSYVSTGPWYQCLYPFSPPSRLFLLIPVKPPPPSLIQTQRILPRLFLASNLSFVSLSSSLFLSFPSIPPLPPSQPTKSVCITYLLRLIVAIHIFASQILALFLLMPHQWPQRGFRGAAERVTERACDAFFEGGADGAEGGA